MAAAEEPPSPALAHHPLGLGHWNSRRHRHRRRRRRRRRRRERSDEACDFSTQKFLVRQTSCDKIKTCKNTTLETKTVDNLCGKTDVRQKKKKERKMNHRYLVHMI